MLKDNLDNIQFIEKMCKLKNGKVTLWNHNWIQSNSKMYQILSNTPIFLQNEFNNLDSIIPNAEIDLFNY